ncbi:MAG: substrate-binding domain-containing protein [Desulfobulbaceae bacterium]|nr:substrate-binding domain-containing protein [Desulfobulbaceae bacterium]
MKRFLFFFPAILLLALLFSLPASGEDNILSMSTTTSTQASGLLDVLLPEFEKDTGIRVKVIAKGTGAAIRDGVDGNVDVIFVHAKDLEEEFVAQGYGTKRYAVMHNDFLIIGPQADPATIKNIKDCSRALAAIADAEQSFISRGDNSGTHIKEQELWRASGITLATRNQSIVKSGKTNEIYFQAPADSAAWYVSVGQGMGKTTTFADEKQAYTLIDRGTFIKYKYGTTPAIDLVPLCEGDSTLANPYGVIPVNPEIHPGINARAAQVFAEWIISKRGQKLIGDYRLLGKQLFYPDAE